MSILSFTFIYYQKFFVWIILRIISLDKFEINKLQSNLLLDIILNNLILFIFLDSIIKNDEEIIFYFNFK